MNEIIKESALTEENCQNNSKQKPEDGIDNTKTAAGEVKMFSQEQLEEILKTHKRTACKAIKQTVIIKGDTKPIHRPVFEQKEPDQHR